MSHALSLQHISKAFDQKAVLEDVSLRLKQGEIGAIVGESGSGKTTLMRIIAGLEHADHGSIAIHGVDMTCTSPGKRHIGFVFQDYALFPHLTVRQNISFGLKHLSRREKSDLVEELLEMVSLPGIESRYPHQLSGGQQQRVAIVRALAPQPSLLLFDEPFSNLDPIKKADLRQQISSLLKKTGTSALIVTHDVDDALRVADTMFIMHDGSIVQWGKPAEIVSKPASEYVFQLTQCHSNGDFPD